MTAMGTGPLEAYPSVCPSWVSPATPSPSTQLVEKKVMFRVSRGLSCVQSGERVWGSDSPVSEELSTCSGGNREEVQHRALIRRLCPGKTGMNLCPWRCQTEAWEPRGMGGRLGGQRLGS
jgi:hypothetical protein